MLQPNDDFLWTRQRHEAERMGLHWDYRLVHGDKAYSFATKKELPEPGKMTVLFEQPVHTSHYALSERVEIPTGQYGAGVTTLDWIRKAKVDPESTADKLIIHTQDGQSFLIKKVAGKYGDKAWLFRNLTGVSNKYVDKAQEMQKEASLLGGAVATHLLQNIGTNIALGKKSVSKYLANSFTEGMHGVVNKSHKARALRVALGATLPDISVAHKSLHDAGRAIGNIANTATPRQRAALRMLSQGRFNDLKKYNFHKDPVVQAVHSHISSMANIPSIDKLVERSDEVSKLWKDKSHPLLSNISSNITKGKLSDKAKYVKGHLTAKPNLLGAAASFAVDPAAGSLNTAKGLMASKKVSQNKYGKKVVDLLNNQFIKKPIKAGVAAAGNIPALKNNAYKFGVNPLSAHLKRTSSALTDVLKD